MTKKEAFQELTLSGPGLDGYAFQADTWCVECGREIIQDRLDQLQGEGMVDFSPVLGDCIYRDTDTMPQPIFFGESDSSQYCGSCGAYLYGSGPED